MRRRVVQISFDQHGHLVILCDDGTIWARRHGIFPKNDEAGWLKVPGPPGAWDQPSGDPEGGDDIPRTYRSQSDILRK